MAEKPRIFILLGQGGRLTSGGMVGLARQIRRFGTVSVYPYQDWHEVIQEIEALPAGLAVVLIGYSYGGNTATWVQGTVQRKINRLIVYDATRRVVMEPVRSVVEKAFCFYNPPSIFYPDTWFFGGARLSLAADNRATQLETIQVNTFHLAMDLQANLHARTEREIEELYKGTR